MKEYTITHLFIYPIKGLGGISLQQSNVLKRGLQYDRNWMLIDAETNRFISQRSHQSMALFNMAIDENHLSISYEMQELKVPLDLMDTSTEIIATVWDDKVSCYEVGTDYSSWFSDLLNIQCKLVRITNTSVRNKNFDIEPFETPVAFSDGYPILLLGSASLAELNKRCPIPIDANRFRANLLMDTAIPHEEDNWSVVKSNSAVLKIIKPCIRCQVISIDQATAISSKEPIKTLARYRSVNNKIIFGANAICIEEGIISVGDKYEITT